MAWNEPGNGDNKNPWGGGGSKNDGPDLDEALQKIQERISGLFGGKRSGSGNSSGSGGFSALVLVILVVLGIAWALSGFYVIEEGTKAVVLRFGAYHDTTEPGMHWAAPGIDQVNKVNVSKIRILEVGYRSNGGPVYREGLMLTQDENIVDVRLAVQYQISNARDYLFKVKNPDNALDETIKQVAESSLREVVGKREMDFVIATGRAEVSDSTMILMQDILNDYQAGIKIVSVNFQEVQAPTQVQEAFDDAIKAREDKERFINFANAYRNEVLPQAKGEAARKTQDAEGYKARVTAEAEGDVQRFSALLREYQKAPEITRQRLYIETMESVFSRTSKVLVDVKNGNNLMVLPLDKLQRGGGLNDAIIPAATEAQKSSADPADKETQSTGFSSGRRERRDLRTRETR